MYSVMLYLYVCVEFGKLERFEVEAVNVFEVGQVM